MHSLREHETSYFRNAPCNVGRLYIKIADRRVLLFLLCHDAFLKKRVEYRNSWSFLLCFASLMNGSGSVIFNIEPCQMWSEMGIDLKKGVKCGDCYLIGF